MLPPQTSCVLTAEKVMNVNVTTAVCSAGLHFLSDLQKRMNKEETPSVQTGYYLYVENHLDEEVTFGIEDDGGLSAQMKKLRASWERIDHRVRDLRCAGTLYVCAEGNDVQLCWVEVFREEPRVRVFSNTVHACGEAPPIQYTSRPDSFWCCLRQRTFSSSLPTRLLMLSPSSPLRRRRRSGGLLGLRNKNPQVPFPIMRRKRL